MLTKIILVQACVAITAMSVDVLQRLSSNFDDERKRIFGWFNSFKTILKLFVIEFSLSVVENSKLKEPTQHMHKSY